MVRIFMGQNHYNQLGGRWGDNSFGLQKLNGYWFFINYLLFFNVLTVLFTTVGSSAGKESTCHAENPASIPGLGSSPGKGISYPLQYSWASLVAQTVKNPPAMRETWFWSPAWEDSLEEGMATHSSILAWRIPVDRGTWWAIVHGVANSRTQLS